MAILTGGPLGGLNLRGAIASSLEPETVTYFTAMNAANESYWPSEVALIDTLIKRLKADGIWNIPKTLWFPVGASIAGVPRYLKHPQGVGFKGGNVGFTQDRWDRLVGLDGRGVTHYLNTQTSEFDYVPSNDTHIMIASESDLVGNPSRDVGSSNFEFGAAFYHGCLFRSFGAGTGLDVEGALLSQAKGISLASRRFTSVKLWQNAGLRIEKTLSNNGLTSPTLGNVYLFRSLAASGQDSNKILSAASIGGGFEPAQYQLYQAALNAARTARAALTPP